MFQADPSDQEKLIQLLAESTRLADDFCRKPRDVAHIEDHVMQSMNHVWIARPLGMRIRMFFFRAALLLQSVWLRFFPCTSTSWNQIHGELRQALEFGRRFGRMANASQRYWCQGEIERLGITHFDAPIMVWSRTIDFRRRQIYFGHWDWIVGVLFMYQVGVLILTVLSVCLCPCFQLDEKILYSMVYGTITVFIFKLYKGSSFDVYAIGNKYFQARGWRLTPAIRN